MRLPPKNTEMPIEWVIKYCKVSGMKHELNKILANPPEKPFVFDGASGAPAFISQLIEIDALEHDIRYWLGGSEEERLIADYKLGIGVIQNSGRSWKEAETIVNFVRIGGVSWLPTKWRWGFGR